MKEIFIYLFITRAFILFLFTMLYIVLVNYRKYDKDKFYLNLIFSLVTFEITTGLLVIFAVSKVFSEFSKNILLLLVDLFKKILGGKNGI